jgi:hypothetical protein
MRFQKYPAVVLTVFLAFAFSLPAVSQEASPMVPLEDLWAIVKFAGQPAGFYHEKIERDQEGRFLTSIEMNVVINRLQSRVEMRSSSQYTESADARLIGIKSESSSSNQSTRLEVTVGEGSLLVRTTSGGISYDRKVQFTGTLMGPEALRRTTVAMLSAPGDTVSVQSFMPEVQTVANFARKAIGTELLTIEGKQMSGLKVEDIIEKLPGKTTSWLDSSGRLLRQVYESPLGEFETTRTAQKPMHSEGFAVPELPAEAYGRTLARSDIRLPHERLMERVKIRIVHRKPELGWPELEAENQRVLEKKPESLVLEVWRPTRRAKALRPAQSTAEIETFLRANPLLQSDDAGVQDILRKMGPLDSNAFLAALALQKWTAENMKFDTGVAIASASEVARDRKGTCFGYSVLLGSLARAAGIPSRFKMGYVYVSGIWGGHAWVEVLVGNEWIPIDAAAYYPGIADAARFSAFSSSLEEGISTQIGALMQLYGNLDIQILEYTLNGRRITVPEDAKAYGIENNTYRNPWLELTVVKPDSFSFTRLDSVWPDNTVVAMEGPQNQTVEIRKLSRLPHDETVPEQYLQQVGISGDRRSIKISGFRGIEMSSTEEAGLSFLNKDEAWLVIARGKDAPSLLRRIASQMELPR